jgi:hypothetical protein
MRQINYEKLETQIIDSYISIVMSYGLQVPGSIPGRGKTLSSAVSRPTLRPTEPPIQWVLEDLFLGVKRRGFETDHSPPSIAEFKNDGAIPPVPYKSS